MAIYGRLHLDVSCPGTLLSELENADLVQCDNRIDRVDGPSIERGSLTYASLKVEPVSNPVRALPTKKARKTTSTPALSKLASIAEESVFELPVPKALAHWHPYSTRCNSTPDAKRKMEEIALPARLKKARSAPNLRS
jgi:hypothetical protein